MLAHPKKAKNDDSNIKEVINLGIPHVGEQIFENLSTDALIQCLSVSKDWKVLAENVLFQRWEGELFQACEDGKPELVRILLDRTCTKNLEYELTSTTVHVMLKDTLHSWSHANKDAQMLSNYFWPIQKAKASI